MEKYAAIFLLSGAVLFGSGGTLCKPGEKTIFSCDTGGKKLSVCRKSSKVSYRYGKPHHTELEISSRPYYSSRQFSRASTESHLRFHNRGYDYVIYSKEIYEYKNHPNDGTGRYNTYDGLYVVKNGRVITKKSCRRIYPHALGIERVGRYAKKEPFEEY